MGQDGIWLRLSQFVYRALDSEIDQLSVSIAISHHGIQMQTHVGRPVLALQDQRLYTTLLAESVVRGVAKKVVHACLPHSGLDRVDDRGHSAVEFPRHVE